SQELYHDSRSRILQPFTGQLGDVDRAYHAMVTWWLGRNGMAGTREARTSFSPRFTTKSAGGGGRVRELGAAVTFFPSRMERVDILNRDCVELAEKIEDDTQTAIYIDPPYIVKSFEYEHDFCESDHRRLAKALNRFERARVVVSYYPHAL